MPIGIDMNNYDISMGTGQIRMSGGGNMTMSSSSVTNQGIYYDLSGWTLRSGVLPTTSTWISTEYGDGKFVALANTATPANQVAYSTDGVSWTGTTGISTLAPRSITYGPDVSGNKYFVVIGDGGTGNRCMTSTNGISWTGKSITSNDTTWRGIANGNGMFVAVASAGSTAGRIAYTNNPNLSGSWTIPSFDGSNNSWFGVAYGNGTFVAVGATGGTSNQVAYSTNGINWTRTSSTVDTSWYGVVYGNGLFVAGGTPGAASTHIMTSPDGITWTTRTSPSAATFLASGSIYTGGLFVSVSNNFDANSRCLISQDGITWSLRNTSVLPSINTVQIAYGVVGGVGRVVATGASTNSVITADIIQTNISSNLAKNNVFLGNDISMTDGLPAGYNWMTQNSNVNGLRGICYGVPTTGIYAGKGLFVAVSNNRSPYSNVRTSVDGINWVAQTTDASANQGWNSVCFGYPSTGMYSTTGLFVAISYDNSSRYIMTSDDGVNWITRNTPSGLSIERIAFGNGVFIGLGVSAPDNNKLIRSVDGINWTKPSINAPTVLWHGIIYANNRFVAVGENGYTMYSLDSTGSTWSTPTIAVAGVANLWSDIAYGNGLFVVTSQNGTGNRVMTSPNGITWTIRTSAADNNWYNVSYGNGLFVASGDPTNATNDHIMVSTDGINWTCRNVPYRGYYGIAYGVVSSGIYAGQGIFVVVTNGTNCIISVPGAQNNIAIGNNITVDGLNSVAIGYGAKCTASNQVVIGSSGTNVGIGTSNPQFTLDVNGNMKAAGVFGLNIPSSYHTPNDGGALNWIRVGTFTAPQGGNICIIKIYQNVGYTAITGASENNEVTIFFKTSNNQSGFNNPTGFAADSNYYQIGTSNIFDNPPIWVGNAPGISATQYTLYLRLFTYSSGTFYTAQITPANNCTWVNQYAHNSSPPSNVNSSTILVATNSPFAVNGSANITSGIINATSIPSSIPNAIGGTNFISYQYVNVGLSVGGLFEKKIAITRIGSLVYMQGAIVLNPGANTTTNIAIPTGFTGTGSIQLLLNVTPTNYSAPNPSISSATGIITITASSLNQNVPNYTFITMLLGLGSAVAY